MNVKQKNTLRLVDAAMQKIPCDLTVSNVRLVNMFTGEIYGAHIDILDGIIIRVREEKEETSLPSHAIHDGNGAYLLPGLIDTHMHVETTMMLPENLSRAVVPWGTTTVCTDPHEIGNVMGLEGIRFMLDNAKRSSLYQFVLAPSCVPSVPALEHSGAVFGAEEVANLLELPGVIGIGELMDFVGVYRNDSRMVSIIKEGVKRGLFLQGHAPGLTGKELAAYRLGGPISDHECHYPEELREKLRNGMHVNLRASTFADNLTEMLKGVDNHAWRDLVSVCTDDFHAQEISRNGHVNAVVKKVIQAGIPPVEAYKFATFNAAREFDFSDLGAIAPGYIANMQMLSALDGRMPDAVYIDGTLVAKFGSYIGMDRPNTSPAFKNTIQVPQLRDTADFELPAPIVEAKTVRTLVVVKARDGDVVNSMEWIDLPVKAGQVCLDDYEDLQFICVANRYGNGGKTIAVIKNFNLRQGAYACTVAHDSHNFLVVYKRPRDALAAAMALKQCGGGICVVEDEKVSGLLELPVAGLLSTKSCEQISQDIDQMRPALERVLGPGAPLLRASVLTLPCLPGITVTDIGIVDGINQLFLNEFDTSGEYVGKAEL